MTPLGAEVRARLRALADAERAAAMATYLKTDMPIWGVPAPQRRAICRELLDAHPLDSPEAYEATVRELWALTYREEKYLAIDVARARRRFITLDHVPLYEQMVTEGGWWDLVDDIAMHLVGPVVYDERESMRPRVLGWAEHDDLWLRRTAIICQNRHKQFTDADLLFEVCRRGAGDPDTFIRKAIGWALRDYARTDPQAVRHFLSLHRDELSALSYREAAKHLQP